jgi:glucose/arabinose dehydrogenase
MEENASRIVRGRLEGDVLREVREIFTAQPWKKNASRFGCRLLFAPDGKLLVTLGDGYDYRDEAQTLDDHFGKVVRLNDDGSAPRDNPFRSRAGTLPDVFTYGHRNIQGIARRPGTREIWIHEHGPKGGDEVNVLRAGANYGWPAITYGIDYSGAIISDKTALPGMEQPVRYWVPSIAPCGMDFYDGDRFPEWRGDLFVGALAARELRRVDLDASGRVLGQESLLKELEKRIREVRSGPDGYLYVLTDELEGKLLRIVPRTR